MISGMAAPTPKQSLDLFLDKFTPAIAKQARTVLKKMRSRLPGAVELVYDNVYALVIGFGPTERPSDAVFSVVVFPRWILLYFLLGAVLPDPQNRLKGSGKVGRHIRLDGPETLDDPAVQELIDDALELAEVKFDSARKGRIVIRAVARKQRPRRPS